MRDAVSEARVAVSLPSIDGDLVFSTVDDAVASDDWDSDGVDEDVAL